MDIYGAFLTRTPIHFHVKAVRGKNKTEKRKKKKKEISKKKNKAKNLLKFNNKILSCIHLRENILH